METVQKTLNLISVDHLLKMVEMRVNEQILPGKQWSLEKGLLKVAEELGEASEFLTKDLEDNEGLDKEVCDIILSGFVIAAMRGISSHQFIAKFNETSKKKGSSIYIGEM